jgi:hypothetical protein
MKPNAWLVQARVRSTFLPRPNAYASRVPSEDWLGAWTHHYWPCTPVRGHDDYGLDLYCALSERVGQVAALNGDEVVRRATSVTDRPRSTSAESCFQNVRVWRFVSTRRACTCGGAVNRRPFPYGYTARLPRPLCCSNCRSCHPLGGAIGALSMK